MGAVALSVADLVLRRSRMVIPYLVFLLGVVGPDVGGTLGSGHPTFGSLRLIDFALLVGVCVLGATTLLALRQKQLSVSMRALPEWVATHWLSAGGATLVCYLVLRWLLLGPHVDSLVKADVRLLGLAVGTGLLVNACNQGTLERALTPFCALGPLLALKASAIHLSHLWAIGAFDRLQASTVSASTFRVVLNGGDTLLTIIPALSFLCLDRASSSARRGVFAFCAVSAWGGLLISGTRTSLIISLVLVAFVMVGLAITSGARRWLAALAIIIAIAVLAVVVSGAGSRFTTADAPHVGLNFRKDEVDSFFHLPDRQLLLGQGLGGHFLGQDVNGHPVNTGWAHELPLWLVLKVGYVGLAGALLLAAAFFMYALRSVQGEADHLAFDAGVVIVFGVLLLSFTLNRVGLPEGAVTLAIGMTLMCHAQS